MKLLSKILLFAIIISTFFLCKRKEEFPDIPEIEFISFQKVPYDSLRGIITISYKDGNGDIGLASSDTFPPFNPESKYYYNFLITYYELQNAKLTEVPIVVYNPQTQEFDTLSLSARVPILTPKGKVKAIEGLIRDTIFIYNPYSTFDTIKFDITLVDRALNESNHVSTPLIIR